jgi:hypothetical protein
LEFFEAQGAVAVGVEPLELGRLTILLHAVALRGIELAVSVLIIGGEALLPPLLP